MLCWRSYNTQHTMITEIFTFVFIIRKIDSVRKWLKQCMSMCVFAYCSHSSVSGPWHQLCLRGKQLLVEWREERVSSERVTLTEPTELLHVKAAQWTQHCHPLVQLQRRTPTHLNVDRSISCKKKKAAFLWLLSQACLYLTQRHIPCALGCLGCLDVKCVLVLTPRFFGPAEPCLCLPGMDGLHRIETKAN